MAYNLDKWVFPNSNEYEYKFAGNYGAKGEKREKRQKATPEVIEKQNQYNREKKMRRLIKANFYPEDYWVTLKYPKGTRKPVGEVKKDLKYFLEKMRKVYKKVGEAFKFIYRMEIGKRGGIHIHMILNRIRELATDLLIKEMWVFGNVNYEILHERGGYQQLAEYIVKQPREEEYKQIQLFDEEEQKQFVKYSSSRNLVRPEPERKIYLRRTVEKIKNQGVEGLKPSEGYYIDPDSVRMGKNKYTGLSYIQYTEYRLKEVGRKEYEVHSKKRRD